MYNRGIVKYNNMWLKNLTNLHENELDAMWGWAKDRKSWSHYYDTIVLYVF